MLALGAGGSALADDHFNLEAGLPVSTEDAYVIEYGGVELQGVFSWERSRENVGRDLFTAQSRVAMGVLPRFQLTPTVSYSLGTAPERDSGTVGLDGVYQFNDETPILPVFALSGSVEGPYGRQHGSPETGLKLVAAKSLGDPREGRDVHVNLGWVHNYGPGEDERADRFEAGLAYAQPLNEEVLLVADIIREQLPERGLVANLVELGARYRVAENLAVGAGVGVGFGANSPGFRFTLGFQRALDNLFPKPGAD